jgi:hypothetical protein
MVEFRDTILYIRLLTLRLGYLQALLDPKSQRSTPKETVSEFEVTICYGHHRTDLYSKHCYTLTKVCCKLELVMKQIKKKHFLLYA